MRKHFDDHENGTKGIFSGEEERNPDPCQIGNKAMNLWRLGCAGLPVPRWFAIPKDTFLFRMREESPDAASMPTNRPAEEERRLWEENMLARGEARIEALVQSELSRRFDGVPYFAVRSSAIDEDSGGASFAGLLESFLFVRREDLTDRIVRCAGSALSARATTYRTIRGLPSRGRGLGTAVIVQEMIESAKSGVLFTRDPVSGADGWVVAAGYGVGEGVVANRVETDTIWLDPKAGTVLTARIVRKKSKMLPAGDGRSGTKIITFPETGEPVVGAVELESLFHITRSVQQIFSGPQDIEWAIDNSGKLHLLQARPITALGNVAENSKKLQRSVSGDSFGGASEAVTVWDNSNIVESYPGVTTPLTYSFARYVYQRVMTETIRGFTLTPRTLERYAPVFESLIGYLDGRIYYNLTNWYRMVSFIPSLAGDKSACNRILGIKDKVAVDEESIRPSCLAYPALFWKFIFRRHYRNRFYRRFNRLYAHFSRIDFENASPTQLHGIFKTLEAGLVRIWPTTIENDLFVMFFYELIDRLLKITGCADRFGAIQTACLCTSASMESTQPVASLRHLIHIALNTPKMRALFDLSDIEVLTAIRQRGEFQEFAEAMDQHIERYGDRTLQELKLETKSVRDDPTILIQLVRKGLTQRGYTPGEKNMNGRLPLERLLQSQGVRPGLRLLLPWLIVSAKEVVVHRENMRFARTRIYGLVKKIFRAMGRAYCRRGILDDPEDVFFLSMEEVFAFLTGTSVTLDLRATVRMRREEYERHRQSPTPPGRLVTYGPVVSAQRVPVGKAAAEDGVRLKGIGCSDGQAVGRARIVLNPEPGLQVDGDILVAEMTDPGWVFLMMSARGIIVERGSILSHTAIIGREIGIPIITGLAGATRRIVDGESIAMDGATGIVTKLAEVAQFEAGGALRN